MWKLAVGFVVFAAIAMFVLLKAGDKVDMSGEKHGTEAITPHAAEAPASAAAASATATAAAPAASAAK